jgi:SAM-dependent methyltransferase
MSAMFKCILYYLRSRKKYPEALRDFLAPVPYSPIFLNRHYILDTIKQSIPLLNKGRLLDVGCGMKPYEQLFKGIANEYIGIDHPVTHHGSYGRYTKADIFSDKQELPFEDASFDTVICTQVLEHLPNPHFKIFEIARVLKKGGTVFISVPFAWPLHEKPYDFFRYTEYGVREMLEQAGCSQLNYLPHGNAMEALGQIAIELYIAVPNAKGFKKYIMYFFSTLLSILAIVLGKIFRSDQFLMGFAVVAQKKSNKA